MWFLQHVFIPFVYFNLITPNRSIDTSKGHKGCDPSYFTIQWNPFLRKAEIATTVAITTNM